MHGQVSHLCSSCFMVAEIWLVFSSRRLITLFFCFISSSEAWHTSGGAVSGAWEQGRALPAPSGSRRSYLHLLVHFHVDGFDFVQLVPESDQRVLLMEKDPSWPAQPSTNVSLASGTAQRVELHLCAAL